MQIISYDDSRHREQVIGLWRSVFGYREARNEPAASLDRKLAVRDGLLFVAVKDGAVIGTVMAGYDGHRGWIYSLAVRQEDRLLGAGRSLLERAETALAGLGCVKINLQILKDNGSVRDFYVKNGYKVEERISMGKEILKNQR